MGFRRLRLGVVAGQWVDEPGSGVEWSCRGERVDPHRLFDAEFTDDAPSLVALYRLW
jgi:hypothetical protein